MDLKVRKVKCSHCNGTGRVEDHIWVMIFMPNGTKECWDCAGRGYKIIKNEIEYRDYDGLYEKQEIEHEQIYKRS